MTRYPPIRRGELAVNTQSIGGLEFQPTGPSDAARFVVDLALTRSCTHVHLANAYTVALADRDDAYRQIINQPAVVKTAARFILCSGNHRLAQIDICQCSEHCV